MALDAGDTFVVSRGGQHYKLKFDSLKNNIFSKATQADENGLNGKLGAVIPGDNLDYDQNSGLLNVSFPTSLRFIGLIENDGDKPLLPQYRAGDFYIVSVDANVYPTGTVVVSGADWPGLNPSTTFEVNIASGFSGSGYRADTGTFYNFGQETEEEVTAVSGTGQGAWFDFSVQDGTIFGTPTVSAGHEGVGYAVNDILRFNMTGFSNIFAYVKVLAIDAGGITTVELVDEYGQPVERAGANYYLRVGVDGSARNVKTNHPVGNGLLVDITVSGGALATVGVSPTSQHTGYINGDNADVFYKHNNQPGPGKVEVAIGPIGSADEVILYTGDKVIYKENPNEWQVIRDQLSAKAVFDIQGLNTLTADSNNHLAITSQRNLINQNQQDLIISDAYYLELGSSGNLDVDRSYSGFFAANEKYKLDNIQDEATRGSANEIKDTGVEPNIYDNTPDSPPTSVEATLTDKGVDYVIKSNEANVGKRGHVIISNDASISRLIHNRHNDVNINTRADVVTNANQTTNFFCPNNFSVLKKHPNIT